MLIWRENCQIVENTSTILPLGRDVSTLISRCGLRGMLRDHNGSDSSEPRVCKFFLGVWNMNRKFLGLLALGLLAAGISMAGNNAIGGGHWFGGGSCDFDDDDWGGGYSCAPACGYGACAPARGYGACAPACGYGACAPACDFDDDDWEKFNRGGACHSVCQPACHAPVCHPHGHGHHHAPACHPHVQHHAPAHHPHVQHHAPACHPVGHHVECCTPAPTCCTPAPTCCAPVAAYSH